MTFKGTILIIQGLHAVQNQTNNNLLCCYYSAIKNYCWESVLDEQQFQELSPLHFLWTFQALNLNCNSGTFKELPSILPCEQRFLSCMTFSVYKVVRVAFLSPTTQLTSHMNDFINAKSNAREKTLLVGNRLKAKKGQRVEKDRNQMSVGTVGQHTPDTEKSTNYYSLVHLVVW